MKSPYDILLKPVISEESMGRMEQNKYTFRVAKDANKAEIKSAVEAAFEGVKVAKVNTINMRGKTRRMGRYVGRTSDWKKAVVTLTSDSKSIEFFENM
ncbi:MAG: 50S ribosomal protein L23 [Ndongobacter sp.]|nr:50S ribosomal protein L23 [Ndongobacter sp.]